MHASFHPVCANGGGYFAVDEQNRLYLNDGAGTFTDVTAARMPVDSDVTLGLAFDDVDGDGDLDAVFANKDRNRYYTNLVQQLHAPQLLRIQSTYVLEAYARWNAKGSTCAALPLLSAGTVSVAWPPLGTFRLDPTGLAVLPIVPVPDPGRVGATAFRVPNLPSLLGAPLYAQALVLADGVPVSLTNAVRDVVQ